MDLLISNVFVFRPSKLGRVLSCCLFQFLIARFTTPFCFQRSSTLAYSFDDGEAGFTVLVGVNLPVNWNGAFAEDKKHTLQIHWGWIDASSFCTFNWYFSARNSARSIQLLLDSYISLVFFNLIFLSRYDRDG